jgi:type VI secretion system protein ImpF
MPAPQPPQKGMLPSLLDRLLDSEAAGTAMLTGYSVEKMANAVRRDLEELLNTVNPHRGGGLEAYPETRDSVVAYGLPDLASVEASSVEQRATLATLIRRAVERFEPRLRRVRVTILASDQDTGKTSVRFRLEARLTVDPAPEVAFDTILNVGTGKYEVQRVAGA